MGMLVAVVADRFANAKSKEALRFTIVENEKQQDGSFISRSIHEPDEGNDRCFRGRSILRVNYWIEPYERPRWERGTWYYYGDLPYASLDGPPFVLNAEGDRGPLSRNRIQYLYFRRDVLEKYLSQEGYRVSFHMRNWGFACPPGHAESIDVGINSLGLVNAFEPDLAKQTPSEQAYWASFSALPEGGVCPELFETRMQNNPPDSPNVVEVIARAQRKLAESFTKKGHGELFRSVNLKGRELNRLNIGPLREDIAEFCRLSKILYSLAIESVDFETLRSTLQAMGVSVDNQQRQIALLTAVVEKQLGDKVMARKITDPLRALNDLRVGDAHTGQVDWDRAFQMLGTSSAPNRMREAWTHCVDSVAEAFDTIAEALTQDVS
jgi:hypothetical protein